MPDLRLLKEKQKLKKEIEAFQENIENYKEEIKNLLITKKEEIKDEIIEKIFKDFEKFFSIKDKELKIERKENAIYALYEDEPLVKLTIIDSANIDELIRVKIETDNEDFYISAKIYTPNYKPNFTQAVLSSSDDREMIEMRQKRNALENEKAILENQLNYLKSKQKPSIIYLIKDIRFSYFQEVLEFLFR